MPEMPAQSELKYYSIGDTSKLLDVHTHTLRLWEKTHNLNISRTSSGIRRYTEDNLTELRQIKKSLDNPKLFSIGEAANLLEVSADNLRLWEKQGHIKVKKDLGGNRVFFERDIIELKEIISNVLQNKPNSTSNRNFLVSGAVAFMITGLIAVGALLTLLQPNSTSEMDALLGDVLAAETRVRDLKLHVQVPLEIGKAIDFVETGTITNLAQIDAFTTTTLERALNLEGAVVSTFLGDTQIANGVIEGENLVEEFEYTGDLNLTGTWQIGNVEVTATAEELNLLSGLEDYSDEGGIYYSNGSNLIQDISNFYYDEGNARLGLGTDSPSTTLHVAGAITVTDETTLNGVTYTWPSSQGATNYVLTNNGSGTLSWALSGLQVTDDSLDYTEFSDTMTVDASTSIDYFNGTNHVNVRHFNTDTSNEILFLAGSGSGNVGIGTTNPQYKLDVTGDVNITSGADLYIGNSAVVGNRVYTENNYVSNTDTLTNSIDALDIAIESLGSGSSGQWSDAVAYIYANNNSNVVITDLGNIGIGTTSPTYELDVNGDIHAVAGFDIYIGTVGLDDNTGAASGSSLIGLYDNSFDNIPSNTNVQAAIGSLDTAIGSRSYTNDNVISDGQSLTTAVSALDTAVGNRNYTQTNYISDSQVLSASIDALDQAIYSLETGGTGIWRDEGNYIYPTDFISFVITDSGRVGIGTTAPSYVLDVVGNARLSSGSDLFIGNIGLNDNASTSSGATLIGLYDNTFDNIAANTTVQNAFEELDTAVGNRSYTNNNSVTDGQSLSSSIDAIDTAIGNRNYTSNNYVTDTETLTASLDALDIALGNVAAGSTGLWTDTTGYIYANNATSIVVADTGNVGIGTTNPAYELDIVGDVRVALGSDFYVGGTGLNDITVASGATLVGVFPDNISNSASTNIQAVLEDLDNAIGSGASKWTDSGAITFLTSITDNISVGGSTAASSPFFMDATNEILTLTNTTAGNSFIVNDSTTDTTPFVIDESGNVGIGTTNPTYQLDVVGDIRIEIGSDLYFGSNGLNDNTSLSSGASLIGIFDDSLAYVASNTNVQSAIKQLDSAIGSLSGGAVSGTGTPGYISKWNTTSALNNSEIYDNGTNIGIGLTNPQYKLDITGTLNVSSNLYVGDTGLSDNASLASGASLIGLYDNSYSNIPTNTTVQGAFDSIDSSIGNRSYTGDNLVADNQSLTTSVDALDTAIGNRDYTDSLVLTDAQTITASLDALNSAINNRTYTQNNYVTDAESLTASINALDIALESIESGTSGLWRDALGYIYSSQALNTIIKDDGNIGIGTTNPAYELDVIGDIGITSGSSIYIGGTGLDSITTDSGSTLVGVFPDNITNSTNTNLQAVLEDLDSAIGSGASKWTDSGALTYLTSITDSLAIGESTAEAAPFYMDTTNKLLTLTNTTSGNSFIVNDSPSDTTPFLIDDLGRVGIGTTNPAYILDVNGGDFSLKAGGGATMHLQRNDSANALGRIYFKGVSVGSPTYTALIQGYGYQGEGITFHTDETSTDTSNDLTERMRITAAGNVGIGTTAPAYKLDVNGDIRIASGSELYNGTSAVLGTRTYSQDNYVTDDETLTSSINSLDIALNDLESGTSGLWRDGTTYIYPSIASSTVINTNGNIGIGTTSPGYELEIVGDLGIASGSNIYIGGTGLDSITTDSGATLVGVFSDNISTSTNTNLQSVLEDLDSAISGIGGSLWTDSGGAFTYLTDITESIGIGGSTADTSPFYMDTSNKLLALTNTTAGNSFIVNDAANDTTPFLIDENGNVGIGTTNPSASLDIYGKTSQNVVFNISGEMADYVRQTINNITAGGSSLLSFMVQSSTKWTIGNNGSSNDFWLTNSSNFSNGAYARLTVLEGGNVGIGTTAPTYKLDVDGDIRTTSGYDFYVDTIGLNDNTSASSGSSLIGLYDNSFDNIMGNTTIQSAVGSLDAAIGNRSYTNNYVITDNQNLTTSIEDLDTAVGNRTYTNDNFITDSEALTLSIDALDIALGNVSTGVSGIWRDAGSYIYPASSTNFVIEDAGNVGIGTTSPTAELEIYGDLKLTDPGTHGIIYAKDFIFNTDTDTGMFRGGGNIIRFLTGNSTKMSIIENGAIGIGDASPEAKLELSADGSTGDTVFMISSNDDYNGDLFTVFGDGNVGIGTTNPIYILDVNGDINIASGSDLYLNGNAVVGDRGYASNNYINDNETFASSINSLDLALGNLATGGTGIWIDEGTYIYPINFNSFVATDNGRIGIGTTAPNNTLQVADYINFDHTDTASTFLGYTAGAGNSGSDNVALGEYALSSDGSGNNIIAIGNYALAANTTGDSNIAVGYSALETNTIGYWNLAMGDYALGSNDEGNYNIAIGYLAASSLSGFGVDENIAIGGYNQYLATSTVGNVTIGYGSAYDLDGSYNTLVGGQTLGATSSGTYNSVMGYEAGNALTGSYNVVAGASALRVSSGSNNVALGYEAGRSAGSNNIFLGYQAGRTETGSNKLYIENSNSTSPLIWGDFSSNILNINGNLGIGTTNPIAKLQVAGDILPTADDSFDIGSSDYRWRDLYLGPASLHIGTGGTEAAIGYDTSNFFLGFNTDTDATWETVITNDGNLGIGTTAPTEALELNGRFYLADTSAPVTTTNRLYSVGGNLYWDGTNLSAGSSNSGSTIYSGTSAAVPHGGYVEVAHNQSSNDILANGWVNDGSQWIEIDDAPGLAHSIEDPELVAWYKAEESSGNLDNAEGTATQDLTAGGSATYSQTGKVNNAIDLDGANDWFHTGGDNDEFDFGASSFTIGGWFKHNTASTTDYAIAKYTDSASVNTGDGADGALTISSNTNINTTSSGSHSCSDGGDAVSYNVSALTSNTATLTSTPSTGCLNDGDEVLLINLQGTASNYVNVGNYETFTISSSSGNTITFTTSKSKYYGANVSDDTNLGTTASSQRVILQRLPNYTSVTVNVGASLYPNDFDGTSGGIIAFRATGNVTINGTLDSIGKGYRGGIDRGNVEGGYGGEAFCASSTAGAAGRGGDGDGGSNIGANGLCGGGGGGGIREADAGGAGGSGSASLGGAGGGGGGSYRLTPSTDRDGLGGGGGGGGYGSGGSKGVAYGTAVNGGTETSGDGGDGVTASHPGGGAGGGGGTYGDASLTQLMFGSGGGSGGDGEYDATNYRNGGHGGDGGGIVFISADTITSNGNIASNGVNGAAGDSYAGGGGGGAGGSVLLNADTIVLGASKVNATGGTGGNNATAGDGGAGGSGRVAVNYVTSISGSTSPTYTGSQVSAGSGGYKLYMDGTGNWVFGIDDDETSFPEDSATTTTDYDDNTWHHVTAVKNEASYLKLYVDGQEVASDYSLSSSGELDNPETFYLGVDFDGSSDSFDGFFDEVFVYNRALSSAEIEELYRSNSKFEIVQIDNDTVRLYNYSGGIQNLKLNVIADSAGGADVAEWMKVGIADLDSSGETTLDPGDLLCVDEKASEKVVACTRSYANNMISVVTTTPGLVLGKKDEGPDAVKAVLAGRAPIKVTTENGVIRAGDPITSSTKSGVAMKATNHGQIIGYALEDYVKTNEGKVMVYVSPGWFGGNLDSLEIDMAGNIIVSGGIYKTANYDLFENTAYLENSLDKLATLKGYTYNTSENTKIAIGLSAQEVQSVFAEAISDPDTQGHLGIDYTQLIPPIIQGINELNEKTEALESSASAIASIQKDLEIIRDVLGLSDTRETTEATQSINSTPFALMLSKMTALFEDFKQFVEGIGLHLDEASDSLIIDVDMNVLANTTLTDLTVLNNITTGLIEIDSLNNSVNIVGASCLNQETFTKDDTLCDAQTLYFQKNLAGNVNFFDGNIILAADGTLNTNKIETKTLGITVDNIEAASAGKATIPSGQLEIYIDTTALTPDALILLTPNKSVALEKTIIDEDTFRIGLAEIKPEDIIVDWLLVDINDLTK